MLNPKLHYCWYPWVCHWSGAQRMNYCSRPKPRFCHLLLFGWKASSLRKMPSTPDKCHSKRSEQLLMKTETQSYWEVYWLPNGPSWLNCRILTIQIPKPIELECFKNKLPRLLSSDFTWTMRSIFSVEIMSSWLLFVRHHMWSNFVELAQIIQFWDV